MRLVYKGLKVISGRKLAANKAGIERAGEPGIRSSLHQGAAIWKNGESVFSAVESHQHAISSDFSQRTQPYSQRGEIDGAMMLVDLHGVAAAERDVRSAFAGKMRKFFLHTNFAVYARTGGVYFRLLIAP